MNRLLAALLVAASLGTPLVAFGQEKATPPPKEEKKEEPSKAAPAKDDDTLDYEKFVKDLKRVDGNMPLYQKGKSLYLELPVDKLGQIFLLQAAFETGLDTAFMHAGMSIGGNAVDAYRFERQGDFVSLVRPRIQNRWRQDDPFSVAAERTFPEAMVGNYHIEEENNEKKLLLVNVTGLFNGDTLRLGEMIAGGLGGAYQLDPQRSGPESVKGFSDDTVVQMKLHYFSPRGGSDNSILALLGLGGGNTLEDDRSAPVRVTYSVWWRKDDGYRPRFADPRIGYFTTDFFSFDRFLSDDKTVRYIDRFDLRKKDPSSSVSEPVKPIVWTIDSSIPEKYRPAIREGVLRWNRAFEAVGFKDAVRVEDAPKDDSYDHADGRRNVIRMIAGPSAPFAAISLPRTDPFTGEILNASITLDANTIQALLNEHAQYVPVANVKAQDRARSVLLRRDQAKGPDDQYLFQQPSEAKLQQAVDRMKKFGWHGEDCDFAAEKAQLAAVDYDALLAAPGGPAISRDEYVNRYLAECVSHEVGHCLGLRHNFAGSTNLSTAQLADDKITSEQGISASVMDYTPPNVQAILKGRGNVYMTTVGSYDRWAIQYGYSPIATETPEGERYALSQIANKSGEPGHAYITDEDADAFNPNGVRFDCAKDPLVYSAKQLEALRRARQWAITNLPQPGESYSHRTNVVLSTIVRSFREGRIAARFLGGTLGTRNFKGDQGERPTLQPVPADVQRQAMHLIVQNFFAPSAFVLPRSVLESLSTDEQGDAWNAPVREILSGLQSQMLALTISASTTDRIAENAYKTAGDQGYSLGEHYGSVIANVFSEVGRNQPVGALRRDLQRFALGALIQQAGAPEGAVNDDVRLVAADTLRRLDTRIKTQIAKPTGLDEMTRLHLHDMDDQAQRFFRRAALSR